MDWVKRVRVGGRGDDTARVSNAATAWAEAAILWVQRGVNKEAQAWRSAAVQFGSAGQFVSEGCALEATSTLEAIERNIVAAMEGMSVTRRGDGGGGGGEMVQYGIKFPPWMSYVGAPVGSYVGPPVGGHMGGNAGDGDGGASKANAAAAARTPTPQRRNLGSLIRLGQPFQIRSSVKRLITHPTAAGRKICKLINQFVRN